MRRKLVKQGQNALTVTIPRDWIKRFDLKAGNEVDISEVGKDILISTEQSFKPTTLNIDLSGLDDRLVWTYIISAYRKGADVVTLKFEGPAKLKLIQQVVDALLGFAIVSHSPTSCTIKDVSSPNEEEFENILRRIFLLLKNMAAETLTALQKKDSEALVAMEFQDYSINKFSNFCLRVLAKKGLREMEKTPPMHHLIAELETVGDEYTRLAMDASKSRINEGSVAMLAKANEMLGSVYNLFYDFKNQNVKRSLYLKDSISKDLDAKMAKNSDTRFLYHCAKIVHILTDLTERIILMNI